MTPLNDLLLGQTFIIESNEQPLFVNGTQVNLLCLLFNSINKNYFVFTVNYISRY